MSLAQESTILPATSRAAMPLPTNDPFFHAVAERLRAVVARQPGHSLAETASILGVPPERFQRLIEDGTAPIEATFLIDVVAALVRELAVDGQWLLTGVYDSSTHQRALILAEDASEDGRRALRALVGEQYRHALELASLDPLRDKARTRKSIHL